MTDRLQAPAASRLAWVVMVGSCVLVGVVVVALVVSFPVAHKWGRWQVERAASDVSRRAESVPGVVSVRSEVYLTDGEAWGSAGPNYSARNYTAELEAAVTAPDRAEQVRGEVTRLVEEAGGPNKWTVTVTLVAR